MRQEYTWPRPLGVSAEGSGVAPRDVGALPFLSLPSENAAGLRLVRRAHLDFGRYLGALCPVG